MSEPANSSAGAGDPQAVPAEPGRPPRAPQPTASEAPAAPASPGPRPRAPETRRLYAGDWAAFADWCCRAHHTAMPAAPATVATYLASLTTLRHGALARRAAAIADQHRRRGHPSPGADDTVRAVLRAARRARRLDAASRSTNPDTSPPPVRHRRPPGEKQLVRMAGRCLGDLAGLRDRALLLLTAAGLRGERLLALDREHVRLVAHGAALTVLAAPDREAELVMIDRVTGARACPVRALEDWLRASDTRFGPVFRKVDRWGSVEHRRLRTDALRRIFRRHAKALRPLPAAETDAP